MKKENHIAKKIEDDRINYRMHIKVKEKWWCKLLKKYHTVDKYIFQYNTYNINCEILFLEIGLISHMYNLIIQGSKKDIMSYLNFLNTSGLTYIITKKSSYFK